MDGISSFKLESLDYLAFGAYFIVLCLIGFWAGKKKEKGSEDYFLAGRTLPWYVVGTSFIASNISTEHFIGMIGATFIYGFSIAMYEWGNINAFSVLIWLFIPFLLAAKVFTTPEFLEKRFNGILRQFFALMTVICNIVVFLAGVLYGGGLALHHLFGWSLWFSIITLGVVAGSWAIYGGLRSVAWTDFYTVIIMIVGGIVVTIAGLYSISGDEHSLSKGFEIVIQANKAETGVYAEAVKASAPHVVNQENYNRMAVIQPATHETVPWPSLIFGFLTAGIWYSVLNQFMIQRVLGAKNMYHARMGIVLSGYMKILMPLIVVLPGMILFAKYPEIMLGPWEDVKPQADSGYIHMLQTLVPVGFRGLFLAALFGAIQSTINSVLNSTATIITLDMYKGVFNKNANEKQLVRIGIYASAILLLVAILLGGMIGLLQQSLFVYIQTLLAFFAPPFAAVFLLGILFRRINSKGATAAVFSGFIFGILIKMYLVFWPDLFGAEAHKLISPFSNQAVIHWIFCVIVCVVVSLVTAPPDPEKVSDALTINWKKLNIFTELGDKWYQSVILWWGLFAVLILILIIIFSGHII